MWPKSPREMLQARRGQRTQPQPSALALLTSQPEISHLRYGGASKTPQKAKLYQPYYRRFQHLGRDNLLIINLIVVSCGCHLSDGYGNTNFSCWSMQLVPTTMSWSSDSLSTIHDRTRHPFKLEEPSNKQLRCEQRVILMPSMDVLSSGSRTLYTTTEAAIISKNHLLWALLISFSAMVNRCIR